MSSDKIVGVKNGEVKLWKPQMRLRFIERVVENKYPPRKVRILQQLYVNSAKKEPEYMWRDIPLEVEDE